MKKLLLIFSLALTCISTYAQLSTTGNILSTSGGTGQVGALTADWSVGGTAVVHTATLPGGQLLTQGFLQAQYTVIQLLLTFNNLAGKTYGDVSFELHGSASSGEDLIYTSGDKNVARIINGNIVQIVGAGQTYITATIKNSTISKQQLLVVDKASQTITFNFIPVLSKGDPGIAMVASASSGLPVVFTNRNPFVVRVNGLTISPVDIGKATIEVSQAGNANYLPTLLTQVVTVVDPGGLQISIPMTVTPNGDGINDVLIIKGIENFPENSIVIVNRNGTKIYETKNYNNTQTIFTGAADPRKQFKGTVVTGVDYLPQGTYFYVLQYKDGETIRRKTGYFVLKY